MDNHGPGTSPQAVVDHAGAYTGPPGQTRYESVHLVELDGSVRSVAVCRAVNVRTHPELKALALTGQLHRLDDGRELALSFVYHDPDAHKFALVIPQTLAHLELKEWAKLMTEIANDERHTVPAYVKDSTTVLGIAALERFIEATDEDPALAVLRVRPPLPREHDPLAAERESELAEQERSLIRMAEGLTAREGELLRMREQLDTARVDLEIREAELSEQRARVLREHGVAMPAAGAWHEARANTPAQNEATVVANISRELATGSFSRDGLGIDAGALSSATGKRSVPPPLRAHRRSAGPPPLPHKPMHGTPPPLTKRREHDEVLTVVARPSEPPPLPGHELPVTNARLSDEDSEPAPEVAPPAYFAGQRPGQMALKLAVDELWLFVHLEQAHAGAFRHGADLMLQYAESDGYPVVVLSLVDQTGEEPYAIRLALDGRADTDQRVIEHLARSFRARVALYVEGLYFETVTVSTLREGVAQAICDKIDKSPQERGNHGAAEAMVRVLHAPPPLWNDDLPFGPARRETPSTTMVLAAVEQLTAWLRPEKLADAALTYSVPRNVIDATVRRVTRAAIVFGIALPETLAKLAVEHGVASDARALLRDQLQAFRQRVEQHENDLGAQATRSNWEELFAQAAMHEVEIDEHLRALAQAEVGADVDQSATRPLAAQSAAELRARLDDPAGRLEAIRELCTRGHPSAIGPILGVLEALSANEVAASVAHMLGFGEAVGDGLIAALASPSVHLRQCAALALGRLKLRRALVPLLKQLEVEDTAAWQEMARAFGDFGVAALRVVVRSASGSARASDRLVSALAHLANHGCAKDVEKLENDPDPEIAQMARKAMARRSRMEWEDLAVREQRTLTDASPVARLSQAFFAEASKVDI